ncbi:MAG: site-specific integrase [Bacteroides sp.]
MMGLYKRNETEGKKLSIRFNLKQQCVAERLTQIMLVTTVNSKRIRVYTKLRVEPRYWDRRNYRCIEARGMTRRGRNQLRMLNEQLECIEAAICEEDQRLAERGEWMTAQVMQRVVRACQEKKSALGNPIACLYRLVDEYDMKVNRRGRIGIESTRCSYYMALKRLEEYNRQRSTPIVSFEDFNRNFFVEFTNYLCKCTYGRQKRHYTQNTVINTLKVVKNLLHRAYDNEMTSNDYFIKVQTTLPGNICEPVYLQETEIHRLSQVETYSNREREVRDMFVIACYTALRISDLQQLNRAVISRQAISLYQQKTKELVEIPILKEIAPLIEHYRTTGFPVFGKSQANRIIKILAARCHIDDKINHREVRGGETQIVTHPKWKMISFHTARRSCVTNLYKRGYPVNYVMSLSGHRSIQAFQRYMRASTKELMNDFVYMLKKDKAI